MQKIIKLKNKSNLALKKALPQSSGIYSSSLQERNEFLKRCFPCIDILKNTNIWKDLIRLKNGELDYLLIKNIPTDDILPETPFLGGDPINKKTFVSEYVLSTIALTLGYPSAVLHEKNGALIHQITTIPGKESSQSNEGSDKMKFHQDLSPREENLTMTFDSFMPDWLLLLGLRTGSEITPTYICVLNDVVKKTNKEDIRILSEKRYVTSIPKSYSINKNTALPVHSILQIQSNGLYKATFSLSSDTRPLDENDKEAAEAIKRFQEKLEYNKKEVFIKTGELLIFNNRTTIHGRGTIIKNENATEKRWLQRMYVFNLGNLVKESIKNEMSFNLYAGLLKLQSFK